MEYMLIEEDPGPLSVSMDGIQTEFKQLLGSNSAGKISILCVVGAPQRTFAIVFSKK